MRARDGRNRIHRLASRQAAARPWRRGRRARAAPREGRRPRRGGCGGRPGGCRRDPPWRRGLPGRLPHRADQVGRGVEARVQRNVRGTERVLDAAATPALADRAWRSTINGPATRTAGPSTRRYSRDEAEGFVSTYDETKYRAHRLVAEERAAQGAPIVIVQPGSVYGPGDHAPVGQMIEQASTGKMPAKAFPELGLNMVHVDDVADGILLAYDRSGARRVARARRRDRRAGRPDRQGGRHRRPGSRPG